MSIKLDLLKEGWLSSHVLAEKTNRVQKLSVDHVSDTMKPVSHMPHALDGKKKLELTSGFHKTDSSEDRPPDFFGH